MNMVSAKKSYNMIHFMFYHFPFTIRINLQWNFWILVLTGNTARALPSNLNFIEWKYVELLDIVTGLHVEHWKSFFFISISVKIVYDSYLYLILLTE